jgi:hypothetical protein
MHPKHAFHNMHSFQSMHPHPSLTQTLSSYSSHPSSPQHFPCLTTAPLLTTFPQVKIFGGFTRWFQDVQPPLDSLPGRAILTTTATAMRHCLGGASSGGGGSGGGGAWGGGRHGDAPGPVHLNLQVSRLCVYLCMLLYHQKPDRRRREMCVYATWVYLCVWQQFTVASMHVNFACVCGGEEAMV